jgi:hypothetical protein
MVRRRARAVSNHEAPLSPAAILRDAAKWPLLRMRNLYAATGFGREIASTISAATTQSAPATKNAGR